MTRTTKAPKFIAYYRVSTKRQGQSGLGLDAQRACVDAYVQGQGGQVIRSYQEIESGTKADRPELAKAIGDARRSKAIIVVGKLDRLARDAHLISGLQKAGVRFVACDMPDADETMIGIYAYLGQREQRLISERTKAAIQAAKANGKTFGRPDNFTDEGRQLGAKVAGLAHKRAADEAYVDLAPWIQEMRQDGMTYQAIADRLNDEGHTTRTGKAWNKVQVMRVLSRQ